MHMSKMIRPAAHIMSIAQECRPLDWPLWRRFRPACICLLSDQALYSRSTQTKDTTTGPRSRCPKNVHESIHEIYDPIGAQILHLRERTLIAEQWTSLDQLPSRSSGVPVSNVLDIHSPTEISNHP